MTAKHTFILACISAIILGSFVFWLIVAIITNHWEIPVQWWIIGTTAMVGDGFLSIYIFRHKIFFNQHPQLYISDLLNAIFLFGGSMLLWKTLSNDYLLIPGLPLCVTLIVFYLISICLSPKAPNAYILRFFGGLSLALRAMGYFGIGSLIFIFITYYFSQHIWLASEMVFKTLVTGFGNQQARKYEIVFRLLLGAFLFGCIIEFWVRRFSQVHANRGTSV